MKDEEMAEEYLTRTVCQGCRNICEGDCAYAKPVRQAFLAGLKTGRQPIEEAVEIIRELGGIVREGVTCHYLTDCEITLHRATIFLKENTK